MSATVETDWKAKREAILKEEAKRHAAQRATGKRAPPVKFTQELADDICTHLANGIGLREYCRRPGTPALGSVFRWVDENEAFREQYARARLYQADADVDQINDLAKLAIEGGIDPTVARVAIDALKWTSSRRAPKKYGDKLELAGDQDRPLSVTITRRIIGPDGP